MSFVNLQDRRLGEIGNMAVGEFIFHRTEDGSYVRKLFGCETIMAHMAEYLEGCSHITVTASIILPHGLSKDTLRDKTKDAWIALRHQSPGIALRGFKHEDGLKQFAFRYEVPKVKDDVEKWAAETLIYNDESTSFIEWHSHLRNDVWWPVSANRYSMELHISPTETEDEWLFGISVTHANGDGRSVFKLLELYLDYLQEALQANGNITDGFTWGEEVSRLQQPAPLIPSIVASGLPPTIPDELLPPSNMPSPPPIWTYPLPPTGLAKDALRFIKFSKDESLALYKAAKAHGRTITQLLTALQILAQAEAAINHAGKEGKERFNEVVASYESATHHNICLNTIDYRTKLQGGYESITSSVGSPLLSIITLPLFVPIEGIKKLLVIDKEGRTASRATDPTAFWDLLAKGIADAWGEVDKSIEGFLTQSMVAQALADHGYFIPSVAICGTYTAVSSTGDLDRLGTLKQYFPPEKNKPFTITDIALGVLTRATALSCMTFQINGELHCQFATALDGHAAEEFDMEMDSLLEWAKLIL